MIEQQSAAAAAAAKAEQVQARVDARWQELMVLAELGQLTPATFREIDRLRPEVSPELIPARLRGAR